MYKKIKSGQAMMKYVCYLNYHDLLMIVLHKKTEYSILNHVNDYLKLHFVFSNNNRTLHANNITTCFHFVHKIRKLINSRGDKGAEFSPANQCENDWGHHVLELYIFIFGKADIIFFLF